MLSEKQERIEGLEQELEDVSDKLKMERRERQRFEKRCRTLENGIDWLRSKLNEYEDAPSNEEIEKIGEFVEENLGEILSEQSSQEGAD